MGGGSGEVGGWVGGIPLGELTNNEMSISCFVEILIPQDFEELIRRISSIFQTRLVMFSILKISSHTLPQHDFVFFLLCLEFGVVWWIRSQE